QCLADASCRDGAGGSKAIFEGSLQLLRDIASHNLLITLDHCRAVGALGWRGINERVVSEMPAYMLVGHAPQRQAPPLSMEALTSSMRPDDPITDAVPRPRIKCNYLVDPPARGEIRQV